MPPPDEKEPDDQPKHKAKATSAIVEQRVQDVLRIRLDGAEGWDVRLYVAEKEKAGEQPWALKDGDKPLSDRQIRNYVRWADELIAESCRASRKQQIRRHMAQRRSLYSRAVSAGDVKAALAVLADLARLQDLYPAAKIRTESTSTLKMVIVEEIVGGEDGGTHHENGQAAPGAGRLP